MDHKMAAIVSPAMFLTGEGHDHRGRFLADVLSFDDATLERSHDYIQWLFPLPEASRFSTGAPVLNHEEIAFIHASGVARANLLAARDQMLAFYRESDHWLVPFDHNHLRITRIIRCLALCVGEEEARSFHRAILALVEAAGGPVNEESLRYWRDAADSE
jgi:Opioid growth factor receptor (OGFr) conserved region